LRTSLAVAALLLSAATASADIDARAQLGFGGRWIVDAATPLTLDLANSGAEPVTVEIVVSQGQGMIVSNVVHRRIVEIQGGQRRQELFVVPGSPLWSGGVSVALEVDPVVVIHSPTKAGDRGTLTFDVSGAGGAFSGGQITYASHVVAVVGDSRSTLSSRIASLLQTPESQQTRPSQRVEPLDVPAELLRLAPLGLDGVDALVLCDPDAQTCADPAVLAGVLDWVALGGTLVVSLGEHAGQFAASPLAAEMPATWTGSGRTPYSLLVAELCDEQDTQESLPGPWTRLLPKPGAKADDRGQHADGSPLGVEKAFGLGRIVLAPYDVRGTLVPTWVAAKELRAVLGPLAGFDARVHLPEKDDGNYDYSWAGDTYNQPIVRTLQAGAFAPPPLPLVVLGIILYVVVVGPLDWVVLRRMKKERLTTLTFLGAVVAFTLLAYGASLVLFSSGARVNRIVLADLVDAGRDGRQLLRFMDLAGYYSPTGTDQELTYPAPAVVMPPSLPGFNTGGDVGSTMPVQVISSDPIRPRAVVQLAFRSQRVVRVVSSGTIGPTIDVEWQGGGVRVINGLPVDLDEVFVYTSAGVCHPLGAVPAGATSKDGAFVTERVPRVGEGEEHVRYTYWGEDDDRPVNVPLLLDAMTLGPRNQPEDSPAYHEARAALRKAGVDRTTAFARGKALVVAHARRFPAALPGTQVEGDTHVVFRKEVESK
jgi:hypothetical protein